MKNKPRSSKDTKDFETLLLKKSVQHIFEAYYRLIRENKLSDHAKFMNIKDECVVCEILNVDLSGQKRNLFPKPQEIADAILIRICPRVI
jgi:hypothetical protein